MDGDSIQDIFTWMDIEDIVSYLNNYEIDFYASDNIESIIQAIYDKISTIDDAVAFAYAFKRHISNGIIVARMYSVMHKRMMTLMDALISDSFMNPSKLMVIEALEREGFRYASECTTHDIVELYDQYLQSEEMSPFIEEIQMEYDYEYYRNHKASLHENLMQYLFHPTRIAKWIMDGNDPETYLS